MERLVRKYEQRYRRAKDEMTTWEVHHGRLVKQFNNAAAIIVRLPVLVSVENYGVLGEEMSMATDLPAAQTESLELLLKSMFNTLSDLERVLIALEKIWRDGSYLLKAERPQPTTHQLKQRVGPRPSLQDCVDGLHSLYQMHLNEYTLKAAIVSSLSYDSRAEDIGALQTLLAEQPNIPSNEVQYILDLISAGEGKYCNTRQANLDKNMWEEQWRKGEVRLKERLSGDCRHIVASKLMSHITSSVLEHFQMAYVQNISGGNRRNHLIPATSLNPSTRRLIRREQRYEYVEVPLVDFIYTGGSVSDTEPGEISESSWRRSYEIKSAQYLS